MDANKKAIDYVATNVDMDIPAILRLKPAEPQVRDGAMRIKLQTAPRVASVADSATEAECRAYQKMMGTAVAGDVSARADPELLAQIPRLKETLLALDSEMKANASSELEKRLAVHARILELQGAQLTEVQQAMRKTIQNQKMHEKLHIEMGRKVLEADQTSLNLQASIERGQKLAVLHSDLHEVMGQNVLQLKTAMERFEDKSSVHDKLHMETGNSVLELKKTAKDSKKTLANTEKSLLELRKNLNNMQTDFNLHHDLHEEIGSRVLAMQNQIGSIQRDSALHSQIHMQVGTDLNKVNTELEDLRSQSQLWSSAENPIKRCVDKGKRATRKDTNGMHDEYVALSTQNFASARGSDLDVRKKLEELEKKLEMHHQMHQSTTNVVRGLGLQIKGAATDATSLQKEKRMLALLETDLATCNSRGQNRKK